MDVGMKTSEHRGGSNLGGSELSLQETQLIADYRPRSEDLRATDGQAVPDARSFAFEKFTFLKTVDPGMNKSELPKWDVLRAFGALYLRESPPRRP